MSKDFQRRAWSRHWLVLLLFGCGIGFFWPSGRARSQNLIFYLPSSHAVLPLHAIRGVQYLSALRLLTIFGQMGGLHAKRKAITIWFGNTRIVLRENNRIVRMDNAKLRLAHPVRVVKGDWMVPTEFLTSVLPTLLNQPVRYRVADRQVLIGNVHPNTFSVAASAVPHGTELTFRFTQPIQLQTAARNGKWVIFLGSHPVESTQSAFRFANSYVPEARFDDQDGIPKLILTPSSVGLDFFPSLTGGGRVLVALVKQPPPSPASRPQPTGNVARPLAATGQSAATLPQAATAVPPIIASPTLPVVVLDAGHGGTDDGARGENGLLEKNLTAELVARVRVALLASGKYKVVLTRVGDVNLSSNQRDVIANLAHPLAFISFHAGNMGLAIPRINVYSYAPSSPPDPNLMGAESPLFVPWNQVQLAYAAESQQLALDLQQQLEATTHEAGSKPWQVPVRVLRSVAAPAVAIEVGSLAPDTNPTPLTNPTFQNQIAIGVVMALAAFQAGAS